MKAWVVRAGAEGESEEFNLRTWSSGDLIRKITENYDRLTKEIQAELPLKQIWTLTDDIE